MKKTNIDKTNRLEFEEYLQKIEPDIKGKSFAYRIWGLEPEDTAQELRLHLMEKFHLFDSSKSSFRTWANRVMRNKLTDLERTNRKEKNITYASQFQNSNSYDEENSEDNIDIFEEVIASDNGKIAEEITSMVDNQTILDAVEELPERQQQVVKLHIYENYPFGEIAEELGINEKTAKRDWEKAKDMLGERLQDFAL